MFTGFLKAVFGSRNQRLVKRYRKQVEQINALEPSFEKLSDEEILQKTAEFKARYQKGETLNQLLPEAFALVREAGKRSLNMRHFDVQLIGGMVLHDGKIAEMSTGEGKTLMATLPVYLNSLAGSVHVVTVNDYLARRDAQWMGPLYRALGLTVGVVVPRMRQEVKKQSYLSDVVYATNNELGFDYLRNKMAFTPEECLQKELHFAIVDEVDSILIDEARTPLIISGQAEDSSDLYISMNEIAPQLTAQAIKDGPGDYAIDEKSKQIALTEEGHNRVEALLVKAGLLSSGKSLYDPAHIGLLHHLNASLRAHALFKRDVDYLVHNNEVVIVDEHTGRTMPGRRWSDGLHQAVEAKERVSIQSENQTLASITFQNFFRLYGKLAGMTGTADTEAYEFQQIYGLEVVVIPTNRPCVRQDHPDMIYLTKEEKFEAIVAEIKECVKLGQPVLVGTASIETSELLSNILQKHKIKHQVLNAKYHDQEAQIVAEAGRPATVTIATNMAGRGTDIVLGGSKDAELRALEEPTREQVEAILAQWQERHDAVVKAGGLHIIGTERHESRRIDNQLRGRAGRQGDPGASRFYLSLEDNLMRIFGSDKMAGLMRRLGVQRGESITHPWVSRAIENAQRKVEGHNFDIRKQLLEYDNVANDQRKVMYDQRDALMATEDISENIVGIRESVVNAMISEYIPLHSVEDMWDIEGLEQALDAELGLKLPVQQWLENEKDLHEDSLRERILQKVTEIHEEKEARIGAETMRRFEKSVMLHALDTHWKDHLSQMEHLRQSIFLRGYAQKDPKQEYKREAFNLFTNLLDSIKRQVISILTMVEIDAASDVEAAEAQEAQRRQFNNQAMEFRHPDINMALTEEEQNLEMQPKMVANGDTTSVSASSKVGRNENCPCGSGKKYKHCHGRLA
ncbi:preprotein translocase subunit SecA [Candidatus Berkiella aquae]|uniref:Protein translocase subunit SecA n=1 Tax=Candidatus Berkiella aquae TaxID=295108 RepID=A0A0Q9YGS2_9GAMM|nr:preprotein translocase subunit SecA [Candidatus Berkiella aquae]MCS5710817.1 preprotein translocase subunit SecA [Candidatus Berkiella aquae]